MARKRKRRIRSSTRGIRILGLSGLAVSFVLTGYREMAITPLISDPTASRSVRSPLDDFHYLMEAAGVNTKTPSTSVGWDLPNLDHPRVDYWVERFTTDRRGDFEIFLARKGRYEPMIRSKLHERGMPQDLIYLAMIESGFNPKAYSSAAASGIWQFIAPTGERYGLDINRAVDERNDPEKATDAALSYLSDLYDRFDSWYLAAASYNTGENRVGRIMREVTGAERGSDESYYRIWDRLPRETRDYVPLMVAAARIAKEPEKYGFDHVEPHEPLQASEITAAPATPLAMIARQTGASVAEIRSLNPHFKLDRTRNDMPSTVLVPAP